MVKPISPAENETVPLLTDVMKQFENNVEENAKVEAWAGFASDRFGTATVPLPVRFEWDPGDEVLFELSDAGDFSRILRSAVSRPPLEIYNLIPGKRYWWRTEKGAARTFVTESGGPRWINIPGTWNVRDIGGSPAAGGRTVRYGMFIRGAEIDHPEEDRTLTDEGKRVMREDLKIRTDLDLRDGKWIDYVSSPAGPDIRSRRISADTYELFKDPDVCRRLFDVFSDPDSYPIYAHCAIGCDRTGSVTGVLEMILGVPAEYIARDYERSTLALFDSRRTRHDWPWEVFLNQVSGYEGNVNEKFVKRVLAAGVTMSQLDRIRAILLTDS